MAIRRQVWRQHELPPFTSALAASGATPQERYLMNKAQAKKLILSQLAGYLGREVIVDGVVEDLDMEIFSAAQADLILEFQRRAGDCSVPDRF
ncbi:MAG: hypothetical protein Q7K26_02135 [bacterium]|nr:hypothetical protein [bacterium]